MTSNIIDEYVDSLTMYEYGDKIRVGGKNDGGYILAENIGNYDILLSAGVGGDIGFEKEFTEKYNVDCFAHDGTEKSGFELCKNEKRITYINKNIGISNNKLYTNWDSFFQKYNNIFVKMDIEGAEWEYFKLLSVSYLKKISQLTIEFHFPRQGWQWEVLQKIADTHYLIHYHANNNNCILYGMQGKRSNYSIPAVFECTYVRKDLMDLPPLNKKTLPTDLDARNISTKLDYLIDCPPWVHK